MVELVLDRVGNMVGKWEDVGKQHFLLFPMFSKGFSSRIVNVQDCLLILSQTSPGFYVSAVKVF